jgi:hypothetical protein
MMAVADQIDPSKLDQAFICGDAPTGLAIAREALFGNR